MAVAAPGTAAARDSQTGSGQAANKTSAGNESGAVEDASIPVEWIETPTSSKRAELAQRAAQLLRQDRLVLPGRRPSTDSSEEQQQQPGPVPAADAVNAIPVSPAAAAAGELWAALQEQAAVNDDMVSSSQPVLPQGWGTLPADSATLDEALQAPAAAAGAGEPGQASKAGASSPVGGGWSAVSAQLAAELESELAELLTSAAARLDADMAAAYTTPQVRLPAANSSGAAAAALPAGADTAAAGQPAQQGEAGEAGAAGEGEKSGASGAGSGA